jgi:hypothetical protein
VTRLSGRVEHGTLQFADPVRRSFVSDRERNWSGS